MCNNQILLLYFVLLSEKETGSAEAQPVRDRITDGNCSTQFLYKGTPTKVFPYFLTGIISRVISEKTLGFGAKPQ
jgi:hypothetical protein